MLLPGCTKKQPTEKAGPPERIISLAPNLTEILFELGLANKVAAVSNDSDYPATAGKKAKVGDFWQPNTEVIIAQKPDLVLTLWFEQQQNGASTLARIGVPVVTLKIETLDELYAAITAIGHATDTETKADAINASIKNELNRIKQSCINKPKQKVLWVVQTEPLRIVGRGTFLNELIELAAGQNAIGPTVGKYPPIGSEEIMTCGADVIIQSAMGKTDLAIQQNRAEKFWKEKYPSTPAVKNNRIYVIDGDTTLRLGPRLPQGAKKIAQAIN